MSEETEIGEVFNAGFREGLQAARRLSESEIRRDTVSKEITSNAGPTKTSDSDLEELTVAETRCAKCNGRIVYLLEEYRSYWAHKWPIPRLHKAVNPHARKANRG